MNVKQAALTAAFVVGFLALVNQFDETRQLVNGGNRFWT